MNRARFRRPLIALALVSALLIGVNSPVASAAWVQYQSSPLDTYNRPDLPAAYDVTQVDFAVSDTELNRYMFFLIFEKPITSRLFSDKHESFAAIVLDLDNDGQDDYSLETNPKIAYSGGKSHAGVFYKYQKDSRAVNTACAVKTWSDLGNKAAWIGFSIPKTCLPFSETVSISGLSDHIDNDNAEFDWVPESQWTLNLAGNAISPTPNNSTPTKSPSSSPSSSPTANPSSSPTATPTVTPTATPTVTPTATPTAKPSATPTSKPTPSSTPTVNPTSSQAPLVTWYLHWTCGGSIQCATVMGGDVGARETATPLSTCLGIQNDWASGNQMQKYNGKVGTWCDTVKSPKLTAPSNSSYDSSTTSPSPTPFASPTRYAGNLRVTTTELPSATSRQKYSASINAEGGLGSLSCTLKPGSFLPPGYALNPGSCVINGEGAVLKSGTTRTISPPFTITVTDSAFPPDSANVTLTITTYSKAPLIKVIPAICEVLVACNALVATASGGTTPYHFVSGATAGGFPPLGMIVDLNGRLKGTPKKEGTFTFGVCAVDIVARQACAKTTVTVTGPLEVVLPGFGSVPVGIYTVKWLANVRKPVPEEDLLDSRTIVTSNLSLTSGEDGSSKWSPGQLLAQFSAMCPGTWDNCVVVYVPWNGTYFGFDGTLQKIRSTESGKVIINDYVKVRFYKND